MGDCSGMGDGHPANRLHGLNGNRCPEIESRKDFEESKGDENPQGIHEGDITDDKRDQCSQIAKSARKFHFVIIISP